MAPRLAADVPAPPTARVAARTLFVCVCGGVTLAKVRCARRREIRTAVTVVPPPFQRRVRTCRNPLLFTSHLFHLPFIRCALPAHAVVAWCEWIVRTRAAQRESLVKATRCVRAFLLSPSASCYVPASGGKVTHLRRSFSTAPNGGTHGATSGTSRETRTSGWLSRCGKSQACCACTGDAVCVCVCVWVGVGGWVVGKSGVISAV